MVLFFVKRIFLYIPLDRPPFMRLPAFRNINGMSFGLLVKT
jgi:hypothetical protein